MTATWGELSGLLEVVPLTLPPDPAASYAVSPFSAPFASTLSLLRAEVRHLRPKRVLLEADFRPQDLRIDGMPRANRRAQSPRIVLTLIGTPHGDLRYPGVRFNAWEDNLRAVALALEALRKVDRYGVTKRGEQYAGWKALPAGESDLVSRGRAILREHGGDVVAAIKATHPDHGGNIEDFKALQAAREQGVNER